VVAAAAAVGYERSRSAWPPALAFITYFVVADWVIVTYVAVADWATVTYVTRLLG